MRSILVLATTVALPFLAAGCATAEPSRVVDWRAGAEEHATLHCAPEMQILALDGDRGRTLTSAGGLRFEDCRIQVAPGPHTLVLQHRVSYEGAQGAHQALSDEMPVAFDAQPGASYRIKVALERIGLTETRYRPSIEETGAP